MQNYPRNTSEVLCVISKRLKDLPLCESAAVCSAHISDSLAVPRMACVSYKMVQKERNRKGHEVCWTSWMLAENQATHCNINIHTVHMGFRLQCRQATSRTHWEMLWEPSTARERPDGSRQKNLF